MTEGEQSTSGNRPAFAASVKQEDGDKVTWPRVGVVWGHKEGNGFRISFDNDATFTVDGSSVTTDTIHLFENKPKDEP